MAVTGVIALDQMGVLIKISQGGQGIVYGAPGVRTSFAKSMVYKEYKKSTLASLDVQALRSMPDFLEALPYGDGAKLIGLAAWPCRVVEDRGAVTGFIMPAIPDEFFCEFWTSNASVPSKVLAEFQHLLNEPQIIAARFGGVGISDRQRYGLLGEFVSGLAFLHQRGVSVGDISPKNLLFSLDPAPAVYFIDCDAMRVNGVSLSDQVETPGWEVPAGEERATFHSDRYKLGLLALRLLVGDQGVRDSARLSSSVPQAIASVVRETLKSSPDRRPDLRVWKAAIDTAIGTASDHKPRVRGPQPPPPPPPPPPPRPSRPTPTPTPTPTPKSKVSWLLIPAALISLFAIVRLASGSGPPPSSAPEVTTPPAASSRPQTVTATATETIIKTVPTTAAQVPITQIPESRENEAWIGVIVGTCDEGGSCGVKQRTAPYVSAPRLVLQDLQDGMVVSIACVTTGESRSSAGRGSSRTWVRLVNGAYVNIVYVGVYSGLSEIPLCRE